MAARPGGGKGDQRISASDGVAVFPRGEHQGPWSPTVCTARSLPLQAAEPGSSLTAPFSGALPAGSRYAF